MTPPAERWTTRPGTLVVLGLVLAAALGIGLYVLDTRMQEAVDTPASTAASAAPEVPAEQGSVLVESATAVLEAWSEQQLPYPWWWAELRPLLSPGARAAYAHTDPERLPTLGAVRPVEQRSAGTTATVWFATDAGRFGVDLARPASDEDWRAHRILFPGQESMFG